MLGTVAGAALFATPAIAQTAAQSNAEASVQPAPAPEATAATNDSGQDSATGQITITARHCETCSKARDPGFGDRHQDDGSTS